MSNEKYELGENGRTWLALCAIYLEWAKLKLKGAPKVVMHKAQGIIDLIDLGNNAEVTNAERKDLFIEDISKAGKKYDDWPKQADKWTLIKSKPSHLKVLEWFLAQQKTIYEIMWDMEVPHIKDPKKMVKLCVVANLRYGKGANKGTIYQYTKDEFVEGQVNADRERWLKMYNAKPQLWNGTFSDMFKDRPTPVVK